MSRLRTLHTVVTVLLAAALLTLGGLLLTGVAHLTFGKPQQSAGPEETSTKVAPATRVNLDQLKQIKRWLGEGRGKLTQADVIAKLGPPDAFAIPNSWPYPIKADTNADLMMVWKEETSIEVELKDGRAFRIEGRFSPGVPRQIVSLDNLRKLKLGMKRQELGAILGNRNQGEAGDNTVWRWGGTRELWVLLEKGVVCTWEYRGPVFE